MSMTLTGREAVTHALNDSGVPWTETTLEELRVRSAELFEKLRRGTPGVVVVNAPNVMALDVMALRWLFPAGITPLVLCPSTPAECAELGMIAARAAQLVPGPVFLLLEEAVAEVGGEFDVPSETEIDLPEAAPPQDLDVTEEERELRRLDSRLGAPPTGLKSSSFDPCPPHLGRPEWLLISFGAARTAAADAVRMAREAGQRVNHMNLRVLWPVPEGEMMRASMGVKHILVVERNLGQYAREVRALMPELPVVSAGTASAPPTAPDILRSLQRTPRCC